MERKREMLRHVTETVQGTASQETEDGEKEGNVETHVTETVQGTASQETEDGEKEGNVETRDRNSSGNSKTGDRRWRERGKC